jgi:hypothetical protein
MHLQGSSPFVWNAQLAVASAGRRSTRVGIPEVLLLSGESIYVKFGVTHALLLLRSNWHSSSNLTQRVICRQRWKLCLHCRRRQCISLEKGGWGRGSFERGR